MAAKQTYLTGDTFDASDKQSIESCILTLKAQYHRLIEVQNADHYVP